MGECRVSDYVYCSHPHGLVYCWWYSCHNDVVWLHRDFGLFMVNIFDTCLASARLNLPGKSLAHLLRRFFQLKVDKSHQRSDWRLRPLPDSMIIYGTVGAPQPHRATIVLTPLFNSSRTRTQHAVIHTTCYTCTSACGACCCKPVSQITARTSPAVCHPPVRSRVCHWLCARWLVGWVFVTQVMRQWTRL